MICVLHLLTHRWRQAITGGARGLSDEGLRESYKTFVDPRLNYEQALELALRVAQRMNKMIDAAALDGPMVF